MGRSYAGILGPLAFLTEILRGMLHGGGSESTVMSAIAALFAFAAIGFVLGELAGWIVDDAVRSRLSAEMAAAKPAAPKPGPVTTPAAAAPTNAPKPAAASTKPNPQPTKPTPSKSAAPANGAPAKPTNTPAAAGAK